MRQNYPPGHKPTPEELEQDAEAEGWIDKVLDLLPILRKEFPPGTSGVSKTPCPFCQKPINVARSDYNGHLAAQCDTDDCMAWRE